MAPVARTWFTTLADDSVAHVMRFLSKYPKHSRWYSYFDFDTFMVMLKAGDALQRVALNTFDGFSTYSPILGDAKEDDFNRIQISEVYNWNMLDRFADKLHIRSLVITPKFAPRFLYAKSFSTACAKTVEDLSLYLFTELDALVMCAVIELLGPNLKSLHAIHDLPGLIDAIRKHCPILVKLRLELIDGIENGLSAVGSWRSLNHWQSLSDTLRVLELKYVRDVPEDDAVLVRTLFRGVRHLSVTLVREESPHLQRKIVKFFGGIGKHNLLTATVGDIPPAHIARIRSFYPSTRLTVRAGNHSTAARMKAAGNSLCRLEFDFNLDIHPQFEREAIGEAAATCGRLEAVEVRDNTRRGKVGHKILQAPLANLRYAHLTNTGMSAFEEVARRTRELREFYYSGGLPAVESITLLAKMNPRLKRVHLKLETWPLPALVKTMAAFLHCKELSDLVINSSFENFIDELNLKLESKPELGRYRIRRTNVSIMGRQFH